MKDFERKLQTNVTCNESESYNNNQIPSEGPASYPTFSRVENTDSNLQLKTELQKQLGSKEQVKIKDTNGQEISFYACFKKGQENH